ncbi:spore cortex-lytic enzyme, lytic transglycosylase SleB [Bacillus sp. JCM 19047]|uniref:Spore cortex-lytic enzyme n=1 Tax=Shouchella miscanthi TaxID=2598861 RepID=A0ABU6NFW6_9BACI|nr:spore cortex-lytic enzyme [Shouchella miscanthi]MED4127093.1 spore cortex-lytic enzyme [Shouchella miscanthi]GAF24619.1 spore cortex-lytic enzyme, lytic transglycosylase SleB [Bacillus sp. JCM 19047]
MRKNTVLKSSLIIVVGLLSFLTSGSDADAFSEQVIQKGATGDDVVELQSRLQYVGYYNGNIDGVFGWGTYWAVRNYQYEYGIDIDGLVGENMKAKLVETTNFDKQFVTNALNEGRSVTHYGGTSLDKQKGNQSNNGASGNGSNEQAGSDDGEPIIEKAQNVPSGYSSNDIQLMAQAVYGEARGEPYEGQVAVAAVIVNRLNSPTFPDTVAGVIYEERAFTAVADGQINLGADESSRNAVLDALNGQDPSNNALYYFNPDTATSGWIWTRPQIKRIGKHIFCY